ncbi:MAG: DUF4912 domain-containing protein [Kamptonema sp. SIO1D9]|nr:DUF4912 domain-containing protein [Kamptonema sp. SIO1D9]
MAKERPPLEEMTLRQLRKVASKYNVSRYSRMRKARLLAELKKIIEAEQISAVPSRTEEVKETVEATKFIVGQEDPTGGTLADVDKGLSDLPAGYGESRIVLMPRDPQWCYIYWDIPNEQKEELRRQGGQQLALRLYDVTDINLDAQRAHSVQEYLCDELAREWYIPIPVSDRDYLVEIGYRAVDGRWLVLARSAAVRVPPIYPSDWIDDRFITVGWEEDLRGKTFMELVPPTKRMPAGFEAGTGKQIYDDIFDMAQAGEAQRVAGSLFGSMQQVPGSIQQVPGSIQQVPGSIQQVSGSIQHVSGSIQHVSGSIQHIPGSVVSQQAVSSYVFPSGMGMWAGAGAVPTMSGVGYSMSGAGMGYSMSGAGMGYSMSGAEMGYTMSGAGMGYTMSGAGMGYTMSGAGMGYTMSGAGMGYSMSGAEMGYTMSGAGMGYTMSGAGMGYSMSGVGMGYTMSGAGMGYSMSGVGMGYSMSGVGMGYTMSGAGLTMSGAGFSGSLPQVRPRKFWLVADAELIVYGATEPDATVTIGGRPIKLNPDGTFRFQMSFQDGLIDYPIMAVAVDGEQMRSIHMKFNRETPSRHTNTKEEAVEEWLA